MALVDGLDFGNPAAGKPIPGSRGKTSVTAQQKGAASDDQGEQREHGDHTEVAGDGLSGENVEETAVDGKKRKKRQVTW